MSTAHLLGTTAYGQDMWAQLVWGTRNVLIIALVVGLAATAIAVLIGVAAAYLGGAADGSLSVLTDVLLVIPLFPLLIVIAGYAHGGGTAGAHPGDHAHRLVLHARASCARRRCHCAAGTSSRRRGCAASARSTSSWWRSSRR